jgi:[ribosomal protein S5]-alanine N-acetyltransferase
VWPSTSRPVCLGYGEVQLRPLTKRDAEVWREVRLRNSSWLQQWDATVPPGARERSRSFIALTRHLRRQARAGQALPFAIDYQDRFVGQVSVNNIVRGSAQFASIGYWIDKAVAGQGVVPIAVALTIDYCFTTVGLHRIEIAIRPENTNSLRVVEKLGIREIGFAPLFLHIDSAWRDHRIFAVSVEECPDSMLSRLT